MNNKSFALPLPFPDGKAWAAIKAGEVVNMVYMSPVPEGVPFKVFRQRSRAELAKHGVVWSGAVKGRQFVPDFETTDFRNHA